MMAPWVQEVEDEIDALFEAENPPTIAAGFRAKQVVRRLPDDSPRPEVTEYASGIYLAVPDPDNPKRAAWSTLVGKDSSVSIPS